MDEIKPVAWKCVWIADGDGCDWEQYHDEDDPMPERWDDAPDEITPLYPQQAIDSLREDYARAEDLALRSIERRRAMEVEVEALEKRVDELQLALVVAAGHLSYYGHHAAAHRAACAARAAKQGAE